MTVVAGTDHRYDARYDDDRYDRYRNPPQYYPRRGYIVDRLPPAPRVVHYHGDRYYYGGGTWYQPYGPRYVVVDPPVGLVVPFLPQFGATLYFGGVPHYRSKLAAGDEPLHGDVVQQRHVEALLQRDNSDARRSGSHRPQRP